MTLSQPASSLQGMAGDVPAIIGRLTAAGWCVVPDVVRAESIDRLRAAVMAEERRQRAEWEQVTAGIRAAGEQQPPGGVGRAQALVNYIPELAPCLADPRVLDASEAILGPYVRVSSVSGLVTWPGNERGYWHADWPFNQTIAAHVPAPYPDVAMHLSGIVMLTDFTAANGATLIVPGSHALPNNPSGDNGIGRYARLPDELQATGAAGSMLFYDSRLWHAAAPNRSGAPRVAVTVRYSPWWMNLEVKRKGSPEHERIFASGGGRDNTVPLVPRRVFDTFPDHVKPLFAHWVESDPPR